MTSGVCIYRGFPLGGGPPKSILETRRVLTLLYCAFPHWAARRYQEEMSPYPQNNSLLSKKRRGSLVGGFGKLGVGVRKSSSLSFSQSSFYHSKQWVLFKQEMVFCPKLK